MYVTTEQPFYYTMLDQNCINCNIKRYNKTVLCKGINVNKENCPWEKYKFHWHKLIVS